MSLATQLNDYINAAFSGLWVTTVEPDEAERELVEHARHNEWTLAVWDIARGLRFPANASAAAPDLNDPLAVLKALAMLGPSTASSRARATGFDWKNLPNLGRFARLNRSLGGNGVNCGVLLISPKVFSHVAASDRSDGIGSGGYIVTRCRGGCSGRVGEAGAGDSEGALLQGA